MPFDSALVFQLVSDWYKLEKSRANWFSFTSMHYPLIRGCLDAPCASRSYIKAFNLVRRHSWHTYASKRKAFDCTGFQRLPLNHKPKAFCMQHQVSSFLVKELQPNPKTTYNVSKAPVRTLTMLQSKTCIKSVWVSRCAWRRIETETLKSVTFILLW